MDNHVLQEVTEEKDLGVFTSDNSQTSKTSMMPGFNS